MNCFVFVAVTESVVVSDSAGGPREYTPEIATLPAVDRFSIGLRPFITATVPTVESVSAADRNSECPTAPASEVVRVSAFAMWNAYWLAVASTTEADSVTLILRDETRPTLSDVVSVTLGLAVKEPAPASLNVATHMNQVSEALLSVAVAASVPVAVRSFDSTMLPPAVLSEVNPVPALAVPRAGSPQPITSSFACVVVTFPDVMLSGLVFDVVPDCPVIWSHVADVARPLYSNIHRRMSSDGAVEIVIVYVTFPALMFGE